MRALLRIVGFLVAALLAFWFTAENANEIVRIDLVLFRIDAALPIVIFASVLIGMGATLFVGWRAEGRRRRALRSGSFERAEALHSAGRDLENWTSSSDDRVRTEQDLG